MATNLVLGLLLAMPDKPTDHEDEKRDEEAFNALLGKLVNTPHKPHEPLKKGREPKPAPKESPSA